MNIREILSAVLGEAGYLIPTSFFGSTSPDDLQMCYLANRASSFLREKGFQKLTKRATITLTAATTYTLPADFLELVPDSMMVDGRLDAVNLPTDAQTWSYLISQTSTSNYVVYARIMNGVLNVFSPTSGAILDYEYVSNAPITDVSGATYKERFTVDTDLWLLDADLIILETKWRFMQAKGLEGWQVCAEEAAQYRLSVLARDKSAKTISPNALGFLPEPHTRLWV